MVGPRNSDEDGTFEPGGRRTRSSGMGGIARDVVCRVAVAEGIDPVDLPPLGDAIDAEALEQVVRPPSAVDRVRFEYCGRNVEVRTAGATCRVHIADEES